MERKQVPSGVLFDMPSDP